MPLPVVKVNELCVLKVKVAAPGWRLACLQERTQTAAPLQPSRSDLTLEVSLEGGVHVAPWRALSP